MSSAGASWGASSHKLAKTSFLLGVAALLGLGFFTGIPAIILGHRARRRARSDPAQGGGAGLALSGLALGYLSVVLWLGILSVVVVQQVARAKRIACTNHLHQLGSALTMWSLDHGNRYPCQFWHVSLPTLPGAALARLAVEDPARSTAGLAAQILCPDGA
jgi:hypothetical protein